MTNNLPLEDFESDVAAFESLDPEEADRKYALIAMACVQYVRNRTATGLWRLDTAEEPIPLKDFNDTLQWLEDNSQ